MKLSNTQKKLLRELRKQKIMFIDATNPAYLNAIDYLEGKQLIKKKNFASAKIDGTALNIDSVDLYIMLTQAGEAEADNMFSTKLEKINFLLPLLAFILSALSLALSLMGII